MTQILKYHRFKPFKNKEQTFEITVNSAFHNFSCTRAKMAETNYTRKVHWEMARKRGEWRGERYQKIACTYQKYILPGKFYYGYILFALLRKQEKSRLQLIFVSILHAGHYQICIKILNKIQIPVPKLAVTLVMGRIQNMDRGPWTSPWIWSMDHPMGHP